MTGIDWNVELRKIEREYDGLPPVPSNGELRARRAAEQRDQDRRHQTTALIGAWLRLILVVALAAALPWWPYPHRCGLELGAYASSIVLVPCASMWLAGCTWQRRLARTHVLSIALLVYGLGFAALRYVPRLGHADPTLVAPVAWRCEPR